MVIQDRCMKVLRGTRDRLGYVIDSRRLWITVAVQFSSIIYLSIRCVIMSGLGVSGKWYSAVRVVCRGTLGGSFRSTKTC